MAENFYTILILFNSAGALYFTKGGIIVKNVLNQPPSELQIRGGIEDNSKIIFLISQ